MEFNVIIEDNGRFRPYNIFPFLKNRFEETEEKPKTFEEVKEFIDNWSKYQWWSRCEYEIILSDWPNEKVSEKWDVYRQIELNLNIITKLFIEEIYGRTN